MTGNLQEMLKRHEGFRSKPYVDSVGKYTVGYGRNLDDKGISVMEAEVMLKNDIAEAEEEAMRFPWYLKLNQTRRDVILDMLFNLGAYRFHGFKKMIAAIEQGDYEEAARQMMDSKWAAQVGVRARELSHMFRTGEYDKG